MRKISYPRIDCHDVYLTCLQSVANTAQGRGYKIKLTAISPLVKAEWDAYEDRTGSTDLHLFQFCAHGNKNQRIINDVTKHELMTLYTEYMVKGRESARNIYDILRSSSNGLCPLCGIGFVSTLDHYLPKARYPVFSVNPKNLIPACDTCNKGKGSSTYSTKESQPLNPYFSSDIFYTQDWLKARVIKSRPLSFEFYVDPPDDWSPVDKQRVRNHFTDFNIGEKYSIHASLFLDSINSIINMIRSSGGTPELVSEQFRNSANNEMNNTLLRAMYFSVSADLEICGGEFL